MSGFSDPNVVYSYTGAGNKQPFTSSPLDYRFRVPVPVFSVGVAWPMADAVAIVVTPSGTVERLTPSAVPNSLAYWDEAGGFLWLKPAVVPFWKANLDAAKIFLFYRPTVAQNTDPTSAQDFDPVANTSQLDLSTRLAQIAMEVSRRALVLPPDEEAFTGKELALGDRLIPADRANKVLAFDADKKLTLVEFDGILAALALAGKADTSYVDAQDAALSATIDTKMPLAYLDTDIALAAKSDVRVASQKATESRIAFLIKSIQGLLPSNNGVTPLTVLDVSAGVCVDSTQTEVMALADVISKSISAVWAVGTGNGGLDTGAVAVSKCYFVHLIKRPDTGVVDVLFSLSNTAPTLPGNYTKFRMVGACMTNASGQIVAMAWHADGWTIVKIPATDYSSAAVGVTSLSIPLPIPKVPLQLFVGIETGHVTANNGNYFRTTEMADVVATALLPAVTLKNAVAALASASVSQTMLFPTDGNIYVRAIAAATTAKVSVLAWKIAEVSR